MANTPAPTRQRIFSESLSLLESGGLRALSMRNLATRLNIKAPSLYNHVSGRDEIIADLQAYALSDFADAIAKARAAKRAKILAYRKWATTNPYLFEVLFKVPLNRKMLPANLEDGVTRMIIQITGKDHEHARAVWALFHGLIDLEMIGRFPSDADLDKTWNRAIAMV